MAPPTIGEAETPLDDPDDKGETMISQPVRSVMDRKKVLTASAATTVKRAASMMARKKVGAVLVLEEGRLVGIFTERDALFNVIARGRDPEKTRLADVMTEKPKTIEPAKSFGYALLMMRELGFRHLPVLEKGRVLGMVTARIALDPALEEFTSESRRREAILREATGKRRRAATRKR
jgi:CBS domain-containing protein